MSKWKITDTVANVYTGEMYIIVDEERMKVDGKKTISIYTLAWDDREIRVNEHYMSNFMHYRGEEE
jgi:hypothetical protein|tara:strand:- start:954 stop:1151 length:198 start_codon:yes stop_codon:yes gene_type:complete